MHMVDYKGIGSRVRLARRNLELTQEEASERCDITASFYGNIERGDKIMSVETLMKISKALNVSTDYILFGDDRPNGSTVVELVEFLQKNSEPKQFEKYVEIMKTLSTIIDKL